MIHLFPMCSHQVLNVLPSSSQWVSQHGSQVPNVFPNIFSRSPHFVPYALPSVLEPILVRENWDLDVCMFGVKYFYNGESPKFQNFFLRWTNKKRQLRKRILNWKCTRPLINMDPAIFGYITISILKCT